jgi:hypothetical protein
MRSSQRTSLTRAWGCTCVAPTTFANTASLGEFTRVAELSKCKNSDPICKDSIQIRKDTNFCSVV